MAHKLYDTLPAERLIPITKSDTTVYDPPLRGIWVGTAGDIAIVARGSEETPVTIPNVQDGTVLPITAVKIMASNTSASDIVGFR